MATRHRHSYTVEKKLCALDEVALAGSFHAALETTGVPVAMQSDAGKIKSKVLGSVDSKQRNALPRSERPELIPFSEDLLEYVNELRDGEKECCVGVEIDSFTNMHDYQVLSSYHIMKKNQREWLDEYLDNDHTIDVTTTMSAFCTSVRRIQIIMHCSTVLTLSWFDTFPNVRLSIQFSRCRLIKQRYSRPILRVTLF